MFVNDYYFAKPYPQLKENSMVSFSKKIVRLNLFFMLFILAMVSNSITFAQNHDSRMPNLVKKLDNTKEVTYDALSAWFQGKPGIVMFCPLEEKYKESMYVEKAEELARELSKPMYGGASVFLVFFNIEKASSNYLKIVSSGGFKYTVENMEMVFINANAENLIRADFQFRPLMYLNETLGSGKMAFLGISSKAGCFKELPDRIPFVKDFICEVFLPNYEHRDAYSRIFKKMDRLIDDLEILRADYAKVSAEIDTLRIEIKKISNMMNAPLKTRDDRNRLETMIKIKEEECEREVAKFNKSNDKNLQRIIENKQQQILKYKAELDAIPSDTE